MKTHQSSSEFKQDTINSILNNLVDTLSTPLLHLLVSNANLSFINQTLYQQHTIAYLTTILLPQIYKDIKLFIHECLPFQ